MVARLAGDFYPLTAELHARPAIRRLFRRLTLLWAVALLSKAVVVFILLADPAAADVRAGQGDRRTGHQHHLHRAHRAGRDRGRAARGAAAAARGAILPAWPSATSRATR